MKTSDVLKRAKQILQARGWCQRMDERWDGAVCAGHAIRLAGGYRTDFGEAMRFFQRMVGPLPLHSSLAHSDAIAIPYWNDKMCFRVEDVYQVFDRAIAEAERLESRTSAPAPAGLVEAVVEDRELEFA